MAKKILLLGGSEQQVVAINTAKSLGFFTILCDYLPDNPGQKYADKFYLTSTTDKEAVLDIARTEAVDGIVAYASDPAAPTAAYVSEELGLQGIPYNVAQSFCEKNLFREFLELNGFNFPKSLAVSSRESFSFDVLKSFTFPLIVKPADASGSKGVTVVKDLTEVNSALLEASKYSRNGNIVIEEFIARDHKHVIEAEIFVVEGRVAVWGLMNSIRDENANPLVPAAYSFPLDLPESRIKLVKREIARLVDSAHIQNGAMNIEIIIDSKDDLYFLDVGPRNGGNRLPDFISKIFKTDLIVATLQAAMGEQINIFSDLENEIDRGYWGLGVLHSVEDGYFKRIKYSSEAQSALLEDFVQKEPNEAVNSFQKCTDLVGLAFFKFTDRSQMTRVMDDFANSAYVELEEE